MTTTGETGTGTAGAAAEGAREVASETKQQAAELARDAWGHARGLVDDARGEARTQADSQARRAAGGVRTLSQQLQALGEGRPNEAGRAGRMARDVSTQLSGFAERLEREGVDGVLRDVQRFARRKPGAFLLLCAGAGFAAGRVLKAAQAAERDEGRAGEDGRGSPYGASYGSSYGMAPGSAYPPGPSYVQAAPSTTGLSDLGGEVPAVTGTIPVETSSSFGPGAAQSDPRDVSRTRR